MVYQNHIKRDGRHMDPLIKEERDKYRAMWALDRYRERSPGMRLLEQGLAWLQPVPAAKICDWGCGTGRATQAMRELGYDMTAVDIADNACLEFAGPYFQGCLWELPLIPTAPFDHGYCCDVLEHLPPQKVLGALRGIAANTQPGGTIFFQIARFKDADGLHLCLRDPDWWAAGFDRAFSRTEWVIQPKYLLARATV
jgi:2-polyprenyl-3-methyl-5-hydroxy-6-metoxy-1,4-benzoquinol methylase